MEGIFTEIYKCNHWGEKESLSGPGSTLAYTAAIRQELPRLWKRLGTRIILDAPCGDYNWFLKVARDPDQQYVGGDIVGALIRQNQEAYGNSTTSFITLDIVKDALPAADFWLCRDCLFHLPTSDIMTVLHHFSSSRIPYLCTSHHPDCKRITDIEPGDFRPLNLELPPFNLGKAITYIDDWIEGFPRRQLALWSRQDVARALGVAVR